MRVIALAVVASKLRTFAWGEFTAAVIDDEVLAARASIAIDELIELRDSALQMHEIYSRWEQERRAFDDRLAAGRSRRIPALERLADGILEDKRRTVLERAAAWEAKALMAERQGDTAGAAAAFERAEATVNKRSSAA